MPARSYDINEMLGTKTRALMQRKQGRDLYDLWHAWTQSQAKATPYVVDGKQTMAAFEWYLANEGATMGSREAERLLLIRLRDRSFRDDMEPCFAPDCRGSMWMLLQQSFAQSISRTWQLLETQVGVDR